tara:strand:- start:709 stop:1119 length:411 start_codon:yes stop_codon:yes gene_type:complete
MIKKIQVTKLKTFKNINGNIFQGLKRNEVSYKRFGEIYFTYINYNKIKAWKYHSKMTLNLMVPLGEVRFVFIDKDHQILKLDVSKKNYIRITVPPKIWFGFKGLARNTSLVVNLSNIMHDEKEVQNFSLDYFDYKW